MNGEREESLEPIGTPGPYGSEMRQICIDEIASTFVRFEELER